MYIEHNWSYEQKKFNYLTKFMMMSLGWYFVIPSSLWNWEKHDRYYLQPSILVQLCWSSSRL